MSFAGSATMPSKAKRQAWREQDMIEALKNVEEKKMGWHLASKTFNVPATTLRRRFKNGYKGKKGDLGGKRPVFCEEIENQFAQHLRDMESRFFGLTLKDLKKLVFEFATKNNILLFYYSIFYYFYCLMYPFIDVLCYKLYFCIFNIWLHS